MSNNFNQLDNQDGESAKTPMTLTIRDVVLIIAAVISMVTAWGMFGTRLSVVEEKVISIGNNLAQIRNIIEDLDEEKNIDDTKIRDDLEDLEVRLRIIETNQAQLKTLLRK